MKKPLLTAIIALTLLTASAPAFAAAQEGIAAVVNDSVITLTDIKQRTDLYISGSHEVLPPERRKQMEQQVLNRLIDETLQMQEAKKLGINVREEDLAAGFADISKQNSVTPEEFKKRLTEAGVHVDSLYNQIRANIAWAQVVRRKLRPQVNISESEIDMTMEQIAQGTGKPQYHVAEIFLNVSDPSKENTAAAEAEKLVKQLTGGASFSSIAREFSQAPGAASGGDLGWVQEGQLSPELGKVLEKMHPGQISPPIRSARGYHILFLRELRQNTGTATVTAPDRNGPLVTLKQIIIPITEKDSPSVISAKTARGKALQGEIKSCDDLVKKMKDFPSPGSGDLGKGPQGALPEALREIVERLEVNELSAPIRNPSGLAMIMVCAREEVTATAQNDTPLPKFNLDKGDTASRESVANKIGLQRLDQMAERYLRDLRATAFIDKRL